MVHDDVMNFDDLLNAPLPTSTVKVAGTTLHLQAVTSEELDDMITRYPPPAAKKKEQVFHEDLRYELIARCVKSVDMTADQVRKLFAVWSRGDVGRLQTAVFDLNWIGGDEDEAPLSESASDETSDSL